MHSVPVIAIVTKLSTILPLGPEEGRHGVGITKKGQEVPG
jgi:hypothetical protein